MRYDDDYIPDDYSDDLAFLADEPPPSDGLRAIWDDLGFDPDDGFSD